MREFESTNEPGLANRLRALSEQRGDHPAFRMLGEIDACTEGVELSFAEFVSGVLRAASFLGSLQLGDHPTIALIVPNTPQAQTALWAAELAGMAMPINGLLPDHHVAHLLKKAHASILIVEDVVARDAALLRYGSALRHVFTLNAGPDALEDHARGIPITPSLGTRSHNRVLAAFHTGGTTGAPKLALHQERNQLAAALGYARRAEMHASDIVLNPLPLFHVAGAICVGLAAILSGACQLLPTRQGARTPGFREHFWPMIEHHSVTMIAGVPTIIAAVSAQLPPARPAALRNVLVGGAPLPLPVEMLLLERWGLTVSTVYGMTETAGLLAGRVAGERYMPGSVGPAAPGVELRVVADPQVEDSMVAPYIRGHVIARGATIGPGYLDINMNDDLFNSGKWLITGDLGMLDDAGNLLLTGRAKDIIIRSGHNIEAALIEEAALSHPAIEGAAAVAAPDRYAGEVPYLYVQLKPGSEASAYEIESTIRALLEGPAVPKHVEVVDRLPLTGAGKPYKPAMRALATVRVLHGLLDPLGVGDCYWSVEETDGQVTVRVDPTHRAKVVPVLEALMLNLVD